MMAVVFAPAGSGGADGAAFTTTGGLTTPGESDLPFDVRFNFGPEIRQVPAAMRTMELAAREWESLIADPVTVYIDVDLSDDLPAGVLGQAASVSSLLDYPTLRTALIDDAVNEFVVDENGVASLPDRAGRTAASPPIDDLDDRIVQYLPGYQELKFNLPPETSFLLQDSTSSAADNSNVPISGSAAGGGLLSVNRATLKALDLLKPENPSYLEPDASIELTDELIDLPSGEEGFLLDFTPENGIPLSPQFDGYSIAVHEIGHALGFVSSVDDFDTTITPTPMDLFRFPADLDLFNPRVHPDPAAVNPFEQFQSFTRELRPNVQMMTDFGAEYWGGGADRAVEVAMADVFADQQTSHWQEFSGARDVGLMSPFFSPATREFLTPVDLRMFDLIGWDIVSPDFATVDVTTLYIGPIEGGSIDPRANFYDVDGNGFVSATDALLIINELIRNEASGELIGGAWDAGPRQPTDVNEDGRTSVMDALAVINFLTRSDSTAVAVDEVLTERNELEIDWVEGPEIRLF